MKTFNSKLAPLLSSDLLEQIGIEGEKPVSLSYLAKKYKISIYAVERLLEYYREQKKNNKE